MIIHPPINHSSVRLPSSSDASTAGRPSRRARSSPRPVGPKRQISNASDQTIDRQRNYALIIKNIHRRCSYLIGAAFLFRWFRINQSIIIIKKKPIRMADLTSLALSKRSVFNCCDETRREEKQTSKRSTKTKTATIRNTKTPYNSDKQNERAPTQPSRRRWCPQRSIAANRAAPTALCDRAMLVWLCEWCSIVMCCCDEMVPWYCIRNKQRKRVWLMVTEMILILPSLLTREQRQQFAIVFVRRSDSIRQTRASNERRNQLLSSRHCRKYYFFMTLNASLAEQK